MSPPHADPERDPRFPHLVLEDYFEGRATGSAVLRSRGGATRRQFVVTASGERDAATGALRLHEAYAADDGSVDRLDWTIRKEGPNRYRGEEAQLVGRATGTAVGNTFRWRYRRHLPILSGRWALDFDDGFWLHDDGVLISHASIGRFGIEMASMTVVYRKSR